MNKRISAILLFVTLASGAACSDTISAHTGNSLPDVAVADASPGVDAVPISDGSTPLDGSVTPVDAVFVDGSSPDGQLVDAFTTDAFTTDAFTTDAFTTDAFTTDASTPDAPITSLIGRWRVVGWDYTDPTGVVTRLTDRDTPIRDSMSGTTTQFRANGVFNFRANRMSWSFGTLGAEHFYPYVPTVPDDFGYSATGTTVPGLLDDATATFTTAGGMPVFHFTRNADGTIALDSEGTGEHSHTTLAPAPTSPVVANLNVQGIAQLRNPMRARPLVHPRFALIWDSPMAATPRETHGSALSFHMGYAQYFVVQAGPPPAEVVGRGYGVPLAMAFTFVYDDLNDNGRFDAATDAGTGDESRGFGPLVIAWRGEGTPSADFASSPLADVLPGYQIAHLHTDYGTGAYTIAPYDTTVPVNPDTPVLEEPLHGPIPRFVR